MAANAVIGALRVNLGLDTAAFEKGAKRARGKASGLGRALKVGVAAAATAAAAALAVVTRSLSNFLGRADKISKASQSIGIATEELSALAHAADLSDVSFEALVNSVGKLSKSMSDAVRSSTSEQALAFNALGVSVQNTDGTLRSSTAVFDEIADKFSQMQDGAGKTALAIAIFGRSGKDLIPLLNEGAAGINRMKIEAETLGLVISERTGKRAEAFNDNMTRLGAVFRGLVQRIGARLLPALEVVAQAFLDAARDSIVLKVSIEVLVFVFRVLISAALIVGKTLETVGTVIVGLAEAVGQAARGEFSEAADTIRTTMNDAFETAKRTGELLARIWDDVGSEIESNSEKNSQLIAAPVVEAATKVKRQSKGLETAAERVAGAFSDAFNSIQLTGNRVLDGLIQKLAQLAAQEFFNGGFSLRSSGGFSSGGLFSGGFGGLFASGGIPPAGKISIVGENGPEPIIGDGRARVLPNDALGGRTVVNVMPNVPGIDIEATTTRRQIGPDDIIDVILTDKRAREGIQDIAAGPAIRTR